MIIKLAKISSIADPNAAVYVAYNLSHVQKICELIGTTDTVWSVKQLRVIGERAAKGELNYHDNGHTVTLDIPEPPVLIGSDELSQVGPAVLALYKVQGIHKQREADKDKPKAELRIGGVTRECAQRIADDLCRHIYWGDEHVAPAINA